MKRFTSTLIFLLGLCLLFSTAWAEGEKGYTKDLSKGHIIGQIERMDINRVDLGIENNGHTGLDGLSYFPAGTDLVFLFAGGFGCSGYVDGDLRTAWQASASRINETQAGVWGSDPADDIAVFYVVDNETDTFGSDAYVAWADAVAQGAKFQDLDGDGIYDPSKDKPDIIGDRMIWCAYNDGTPASQRTPRLGTDPMGVEFHQSVWAFTRGDALGNVVFFRYRMINQTEQNIDDFIFTVWQDPDLGDFNDDLIGCDTTLSLGYIYNDADDTQYGANPPAFGIDFFQGPIVETGVSSDTAFLANGPFFGVDTLPGWMNLPMTSFMYYIQSDPTLGDPNTAAIARFYQEGGLDQEGSAIVPENWGEGGAGADPRFVFSGDPVTGGGWRDVVPADKRFMVNTGPFQLAAGDTQDVVVAYVVSRSGSALTSVTQLKSDDQLAQASYDNNFLAAPPMPLPEVHVREFEDRIEFVVDLWENVLYREVPDIVGQNYWEGFRVYQFNTTDTESETVAGAENIKIIGSFDIDNEIGDLYQDIGDERIRVYESQNNLDLDEFLVSKSGLFRFTVTTDAFNNDEALVPYKNYYFAVVPFGLNADLAEPNDNTAGTEDLLLPGGLVQRPLSNSFFVAKLAASENEPFKGSDGQHIAGSSEGYVEVDVIDKDALTGDDYVISFIENGERWVVTNQRTLDTDTSAFQGLRGDELTFPVVDGLSMRVYNVGDHLDHVDTLEVAADSAWLQGGSGLTLSPGAVFNGGFDFAHNVKDSVDFDGVGFAPAIQKHEYFPVEIVIDTSDVSWAYVWTRPTPDYDVDLFYGGVSEVFVSAYDVSGETPRQLNVIYNAAAGNLALTAGNKSLITITTTSYDTSGLYDPTDDTARNFREDAYIVCNLDQVDPDAFKSGKMRFLITPNYPNTDMDEFMIATSELTPELSADEAQAQLEMVRVVPNPYFGYSAYETSYDTPEIKFTHMAPQATVRIFNVAGQLVKTLNKDDDSNELSWDLRNETRLRVASGMYIAHIEVPGVGEKVIKFGVIQREERIDRF